MSIVAGIVESVVAVLGQRIEQRFEALHAFAPACGGTHLQHLVALPDRREPRHDRELRLAVEVFEGQRVDGAGRRAVAPGPSPSSTMSV